MGRFLPSTLAASSVMPTAAGTSLGARNISSMARLNPAAIAGFAQPRPDGAGVVNPPQPAAPDPNASTPTVPNRPQPTPAPVASPQVPQQPVFRQAAPPPTGPSPSQNAQYYQPRQFPQYFQPQQFQQPQQPQQSVTQQAGRGSAQSVSNYLTALGQAGAGGNNAMMNAPGQLGAYSPSGFMGMNQQQPGYGPSFIPQGYTGMVSAGPSQVYGSPGAYNSNIGYQGNQAWAGPNYNIGNYASQGGYGQMGSPRLENTGGISMVNAPGLAAGAQNAPQFTTPAPWMNPQDPAQSPAAWNALDTYQKAAYLGVDSGVDAPTWPTQPGSMYSTSDERAKTNIDNAQDELQEFLDALGIYSYEYKDKADGEGRYISPMAQEFEKSKLGAQAVVEDATGKKMVNYGRLAGVQTAALALLNHKYNALEEKFNEAIKENLKKRTKTNG